MFALRERVIQLGAKVDPGGVPDAKLWYTRDDVRTYLERIGKDGRGLYATTQLTLDILFLLLYGGLLCCLVARLCRPGLARFWVWMPVCASAADIGENALLACLAIGF